MEERMEVDDEPYVQPQHKFHLKMSGTGFNVESSFDYSEIKDYVTGIDSFLAKFVNSRVLVMKMIRCMSFFLCNRDSSVIHLVPRNEKLWIRKVDEHERISTFNYMSDPASDIMSKKEIDHINSFVGYHRTAPWLLSVLWLLSELAVKRFVSECNSEHQLDFKTIVQVIIQWTNKISISY
ncbi:uncharacterized protein LOC111319214 isoform X2 [Stylophora pistillata]|uniref:uncharacterized protein LOC111319214 isoform X2 n=1 Tax=Stylophora pistillata TaxID=50429 RepID=UPI000C0551F6|nr:uncharacterized protein LOC111319214 isoform X2 [Stylophora pistillata]